MDYGPPASARHSSSSCSRASDGSVASLWSHNSMGSTASDGQLSVAGTAPSAAVNPRVALHGCKGPDAAPCTWPGGGMYPCLSCSHGCEAGTSSLRGSI